MKLLVIGGTVFVGRHFAEAAIAAGHDVTIFHRGKRGLEVLPEAARILGDRTEDAGKMADGHWDAVVDSSGYLPSQLRASTEALRERTGRYLFVSTISVYRDSAVPDQDEDAPLASTEGEIPEEVTGETYGPLKVLCERQVNEVFGAKATVVRPGLIAGPYDPTDRFPYWSLRFGRGGRVLLPGRQEQPLQQIDARDLGQFMLGLLNDDRPGVFNVAGEDDTFGAMIARCSARFPQAEAVWTDNAFLEEKGVSLWSDLPLSAPPESDGLMRTRSDRALAAGLKRRSLEETLADTADWVATLPVDRPWRTTLTPEREAEALAAWDDWRTA